MIHLRVLKFKRWATYSNVQELKASEAWLFNAPTRLNLITNTQIPDYPLDF